MGQFLERGFIVLALLGTLFTSCLSCVPNAYRRVVVAQEREVAPPEKLWPSVAMVTVYPKKPGNGMLATGWAIDKDYLMTAGHFCQGVIEGIKLEKLDPGVRVIGSDAQGGDVEIGKAMILAVQFDEKSDLCLLYIKDHGLRVLKVVADLSLVETEDPVTISGAPRGVFPVRTDGRVWLLTDNILLLSMMIAPGNSGSPVIWNNQVIGMVVTTIRPSGGDVWLGGAMRSDKVLEFFEARKLKKKIKTK